MNNTRTIPKPLRDHKQWVCWKSADRGDGKATKVPYNPRTGVMASSTNPEHWSSFDRCLAAEGYSGIGFVFTPDDPFIGVDLDDCIDDAGQLSDEAKEIVAAMGSYAEISPSGRGIKIFGFACKPGDRCKTTSVSGMSAVEVYESDRYFTVTGDKLHIAPEDIGDAQPGIDKHYPLWFPERPSKASEILPTPVDLADEEIIQRARTSRHGDKFDLLWSGDSSGFGDDASSGDLALCNSLAFWTANDAVRIDRMFRSSGRMRDKWDAMRGAKTYGEITIAKAIDGTTETYTPGKCNTEDFAWFMSPQRGGESPSDELAGLINATIAGKHRAVAWKWPVVSNLTKALMPGTLTILCGNPGATKSFLLLESVAWWCMQGINTRCLMLEDSRAYHLRRAVAQHTGLGKITDPDWVESHPEETREALRKSENFSNRVGECIESLPIEVVPTGASISMWIEEQAKNGARVICADPITLATPGDKQWVDDHSLIVNAKKTAEKHDCSVILVTHPKKNPQGKSLDDVSGGAAVTRFAHTVLWLEYLAEPESKLLISRDAMGLTDRKFQDVNRILRVLKARNGRGTGSEIGVVFSGQTLSFEAHGIITKA